MVWFGLGLFSLGPLSVQPLPVWLISGSYLTTSGLIFERDTHLLLLRRKEGRRRHGNCGRIGSGRHLARHPAGRRQERVAELADADGLRLRARVPGDAVTHPVRHELRRERVEDVRLLELDAVELRAQVVPRDPEQTSVLVAQLDEALPQLPEKGKTHWLCQSRCSQRQGTLAFSLSFSCNFLYERAMVCDFLYVCQVLFCNLLQN